MVGYTNISSYRNLPDQRVPDAVVLKCHFCGISITHWFPSDDETAIHKQLAPWCPLFNNAAIQNIPIDQQLLYKTLQPPPPQYNPIEVYFPHTAHTTRNDIYNNYTDWQQRKNSSNNCTADYINQINSHSGAGFYYLPPYSLQCFSCALIIYHWNVRGNI